MTSSSGVVLQSNSRIVSTVTQIDESDAARYSAANRAQYEAYVREARAQYAADDSTHMSAEGTYRRLCMAIELIDLGIEPVNVPDGLLVDGKIIIAIRSPKYRYVSDSQYRWYWYSTLPALIEKIRTPETERAKDRVRG
jgi:hypothetical protein